MMPTTLELDLAAGQYRADRDLLLTLIFGIEDGFADGRAADAWRALLRAAKWMRAQDAEQDK